jgi:hypothetical protein
MPFFTTKDVEPLILEIPPADEGSITGMIMNCWREAVERGADGYSCGRPRTLGAPSILHRRL